MKKIYILSLLLILTSHNIFSQSGWFWLNPQPQGNDIREIQALSNNIVVGVTSGGTFIKSSNGGVNWIVRYTGFDIDLCSISFLNEFTGYACGDPSGNYGLVIKSTNGGTNWYLCDSSSHYPYYSIKFINENTGFVAGRVGLMKKTTNGGQSWRVLNTETTKDLGDIYFLNENVVYCNGDGTLFKTTNGGDTWQQNIISVSYYLGQLQFLNMNTGYISANYGKMFKTTNGGTNWTQFNTISLESNNCLFFFDAQTGIVGTSSGKILKTTNSCLSWEILYSSYNYGTLNSLIKNSQNNLLIGGRLGKTLYSVNNGNSWDSVSSNFATGRFYGIEFLDESTGFISGENGVYKSTNKGLYWRKLNTNHTEYFGTLDFTDYNTGYLKTFDTPPTIIKTTNSGVNWVVQSIPFTNPVSDIEFNNALSGFIISGDGQIAKTTNGGTNWDLKYSGVSNTLRSIKTINDSVSFIVGGDISSNIILKTTNSGENWFALSAGLNNRLNYVDFFDTNNGFIAGVSGVILKTTNGGLNWINLSYPTNVMFSSIEYVNQDLIIIGSAAISEPSFFLVSSNAGLNWVKHNTGSNSSIYSMSFLNDSTGFASGDNGMILGFSKDYIVSLSPISSQIPNSFSLHQNYPNPFNPVTKIKFGLSKQSNAKIIIYDLLGREITTLVNEQLRPGSYEVDWDGSNFASGVYFYSLIAADPSTLLRVTETKRMVLIK
jgi:photosystem II stability/assembly factor-like uncharacterized protein